MKASALHRKYADALDLCEKYGISTDYAVRIYGEIVRHTPTFDYQDDRYTFPVAVVEGKTVFVGDYLYNAFGQCIKIFNSMDINAVLLAENYTWEPPKPKTFMLNGVELVSPGNYPYGYYIGELGEDISRFKWDNLKDRDAFYNAIIALLAGK